MFYRRKRLAALLLLWVLFISGAGQVCAAETESDWYGWWKMDHCSGDWSKMYGYYWDCCAVLSEGEDGRMSLLLWDEDLPREIGLAEARLLETEGKLVCQSGSFLDRELSASVWSVTESGDDCGTLLSIEGQYKAVGKGGFHYIIYLRPWGSLWPGSEDEKPYYYENWYLPLVEAGRPMPDVIGKQETGA